MNIIVSLGKIRIDYKLLQDNEGLFALAFSEWNKTGISVNSF